MELKNKYIVRFDKNNKCHCIYFIISLAIRLLNQRSSLLLHSLLCIPTNSHSWPSSSTPLNSLQPTNSCSEISALSSPNYLTSSLTLSKNCRCSPKTSKAATKKRTSRVLISYLLQNLPFLQRVLGIILGNKGALINVLRNQVIKQIQFLKLAELESSESSKVKFLQENLVKGLRSLPLKLQENINFKTQYLLYKKCQEIKKQQLDLLLKRYKQSKLAFSKELETTLHLTDCYINEFAKLKEIVRLNLGQHVTRIQDFNKKFLVAYANFMRNCQYDFEHMLKRVEQVQYPENLLVDKGFLSCLKTARTKSFQELVNRNNRKLTVNLDAQELGQDFNQRWLQLLAKLSIFDQM